MNLIVSLALIAFALISEQKQVNPNGWIGDCIVGAMYIVLPLGIIWLMAECDIGTLFVLGIIGIVLKIIQNCLESGNKATGNNSDKE